MAISFVGVSSAASGPSPSIAVAKPTGVASGDLLLCFSESEQNATVPSGFTDLGTITSPTSSQVRLRVSWKIAGGAEPASYTIADEDSLGSPEWAIVMLALRGTHQSAPIDAFVNSALTGTATNHVAPSVTSTQDNDWLVVAWGNGSGAGYSPPGTMTERADVEAFEGLAVATEALGVAGATGTRTAVTASLNFGVYASVAVRPANAAPNAPPLATPANAAVLDLAASGNTFDAPFSDPDPGDTPSAMYFRRKLTSASSYEYYNAGTGAFQSTEVKIPGTAEEITFGAGKWSNAAAYNWSVAYEDALGVKGPYAADFTVSGSSLPSVTVTGPTGTITDTSRPPVTWSVSDPEGDPQQRYHAKIFSAAQYGAGGFDPSTSTAAWDSTETISEPARERQPNVDLANATTHRAYVKVRTNGQWSGWSYSGFTINLTAPAAPTVAVVEDPANARNTITVTGTHNPVTFPDVTYRVEYEDPDGAWQTVRAAAALEPDVDLEAVAYDYEAPLFQPRNYRAVAQAAV